MSTDTLELIEIDESLDFKPACEYCGEEDAYWVVNHPKGGQHLLCKSCGDITVRRKMEFIWMLCNLCSDSPVYPATDYRVEPL